ncbi:hypothetical protein GW750_05365 [bacterium]|nr:hypothetical protein [bacterium]
MQVLPLIKQILFFAYVGADEKVKVYYSISQLSASSSITVFIISSLSDSSIVSFPFSSSDPDVIQDNHRFIIFCIL